MKASRQAGNILPLTLWIVMVWIAVDIQGTEMAAPLPATGQSSQQLQIDKGRTAVTQVCVGCHGGIMRMLEIREKSEDEWRDTIYSMIGRGAQVLPDDRASHRVSRGQRRARPAGVAGTVGGRGYDEPRPAGSRGQRHSGAALPAVP